MAALDSVVRVCQGTGRGQDQGRRHRGQQGRAGVVELPGLQRLEGRPEEIHRKRKTLWLCKTGFSTSRKGSHSVRIEEKGHEQREHMCWGVPQR